MLSKCMGSFARNGGRLCSAVTQNHAVSVVRQPLKCYQLITQQQKTLFNTFAGKFRALPKNVVPKQCTPQVIRTVRLSATAAAATAARMYPDISPAAQRTVGLWLATCAGMVYGAVLIGGLTRLTESGLSITTWDPLKGIKPPTTDEQWEKAFNLYKQSPEYKYLERELDMNGFKFIFLMEWLHRNWGRTIGMVYLLPLIYFWRKGFISQVMKPRLIGYGGLLGLQAVLGMVMVQSGLNEALDSYEMPRVSSYRLSIHLGCALFLFVNMVWTAMMHLMPPAKDVNKYVKTGRLGRLGFLAHACMAMTFFTAISGGFVAALDAGLVYNSWPKFADRWIPSDIGALAPKWRNLFENHTTVQFNHRHLGELTGSLVLALWYMSRSTPMPARVRLSVNCLAGITALQIVLGISTLLMYVPIWLAASHQSTSVALLATAAWVTQEFKRIPK